MGGIMAPPNFVVSSSITIRFGAVIEFDKFSPKYPKKSFENDVTAELCHYLLSRATVSFEIWNFFIPGRIWLKFGSEE